MGPHRKNFRRKITQFGTWSVLLKSNLGQLTLFVIYYYYYYYYYYLLCHYTEQPALASSSVKNWRILLEQSFTARMPLLMVTGAFGLGRRR